MQNYLHSQIAPHLQRHPLLEYRDLPEAVFLVAGELFAGCDRMLCGRAPELRATFQDLMHQETGLMAAFALQSIIWQMLTGNILPQVPALEPLENRWRNFAILLEKISHNPHKNLSVAEMAALMKMGKESFVKRFSSETGESPKAFFNRLRAAAIAKELSDPTVSIGETAERFGFRSPFYFSRFFKRYFGTGPQAYRKQIPSLHCLDDRGAALFPGERGFFAFDSGDEVANRMKDAIV